MNGWTLANLLKVHRFIINIHVYQGTSLPTSRCKSGTFPALYKMIFN